MQQYFHRFLIRLRQHPYRAVFRIFRSRFLQHNAAKELFVFWCCLELMPAEDFENERAISSIKYRLPRPSEHQIQQNLVKLLPYFFIFFRFWCCFFLWITTCCCGDRSHPRRQCSVLLDALFNERLPCYLHTLAAPDSMRSSG